MLHCAILSHIHAYKVMINCLQYYGDMQENTVWLLWFNGKGKFGFNKLEIDYKCTMAVKKIKIIKEWLCMGHSEDKNEYAIYMAFHLFCPQMLQFVQNKISLLMNIICWWLCEV